MSITWADAAAVAELLFEKYDTLDPRTVKPADIRKWAVDLEDFEGRPDEADDAQLQAICRAWFERWNDEYGEG
jgi:FeS assembly protein IscX